MCESKVECSTYTQNNFPVTESCSIREFLTCVKSTCFTLNENQFEILNFFKRNLKSIKSEVDSCFNQVIGYELDLLNRNSSEPNRHSVQESDSTKIRAKESQPNDITSELFAKHDFAIQTSPRENNVVIHGLDGQVIEDNDNRIKFVSDFFKSSLKIAVKILDVNVLRKKHSRSYVVIVKLESKNEKRKIFGNCHLLKMFGKNISITDDLPANQRSIRRKKRNSAEASSRGEANSSKEINGNEDIISREKIIAVSDINANEQMKTKEELSASSERNSEANINSSIKIDADSEINANEEINVKPSANGKGYFGPDENDVEAKMSSSEKRNTVGNADSRSSNEKLEEARRAYFFHSEVNKKYVDEMTSLGMSYEFDKDSMDFLNSIFGDFNRRRLEKSTCICSTFWQVPWSDVSKEFGSSLSKKFVKKYKNIVTNTLQKAWNLEYSHKFEECFCNHMFF
ncbi:unnamed protein product [Orchesella dallaii]|uniref:Uncharacterized protein n=1 Tax=Orchesella dallaii TaxID=48710 RepID=A0ABP1S3M9_9HEXA